MFIDLKTDQPMLVYTPFPFQLVVLKSKMAASAQRFQISGNASSYFYHIFQGRTQEFLKGSPNLTQYGETVLKLITSTPRQFSAIVHHMAIASTF